MAVLPTVGTALTVRVTFLFTAALYGFKIADVMFALGIGPARIGSAKTAVPFANPMFVVPATILPFVSKS